MWLPTALTFCWCLFMIWPQRIDKVIFCLGMVTPTWFTLGPIVVFWILWALGTIIAG